MRDGARDQSGENTGCGRPGSVGGSTAARCFKEALAYSYSGRMGTDALKGP